MRSRIQRAAAASAFPVTPNVRHPPILQDVDDALMAPWMATGRISLRDARHFAAAMASNPAVAADLAAARNEYAAFRAIMEEPGSLSDRPQHALFAAIDAQDRPTAPSNVVALSAARDRRRAHSFSGSELEVHRGRFEPNACSDD